MIFVESASISSQFDTAWQAVHGIACLRRGEKILIHAGAGGAGQAAILVSQNLVLKSSVHQVLRPRDTISWMNMGSKRILFQYSQHQWENPQFWHFWGYWRVFGSPGWIWTPDFRAGKLVLRWLFLVNPGCKQLLPLLMPTPSPISIIFSDGSWSPVYVTVWRVTRFRGSPNKRATISSGLETLAISSKIEHDFSLNPPKTYRPRTLVLETRHNWAPRVS